MCVCVKNKREGKTESGPQGQWGQNRQAQMKDNLWRSLTVGGEAPVGHAHSDALSLSCTLIPDTPHPFIAFFLSFSSVSYFILSFPAFFSCIHSHFPCLFLIQHSCSWISKGTSPAEKAECLAGRSLSQAGWDCGIPASHSLGTVFCPLRGPCHNCQRPPPPSPSPASSEGPVCNLSKKKSMV